jgi:glyoxylase-like metal-dependent hydrolase (beta-lactamase superfamily II)
MTSQPPPAFPPQLHVFVRDWLSSNNVVLRSRDGHVLIDTGYVSHAPLTLALLATPRGIGGEPLAKIVNTHCHSDHVGGNAAVVAKYGCPIAIPEDEDAAVERWDDKALLYEYAAQSVDRFRADELLTRGSTHVWGDLEWRAIAAPGHDMSALVFWNDEHGILISGDALWEHGFGFVMPPEMDAAALPATRATLEMLAALPIRILIPGHGEPFTDVRAALDRAFSRVAAFEADSLRMARHAVKVLLMFTLLERQRIALAEIPEHVERVGIFRDFNATFFRLPPETLAQAIVDDLEHARAARRVDGYLVPA